MARTIVISCDACDDEGRSTPGDATKVSINDGATSILDLCPRHYADLFGPIQSLINKAGTPVPAKPATAGRPPHEPSTAFGRTPVECPACGTTRRGTSSMRNHLKSAHDLELGANPARVLFGRTCPLCREDNIHQWHSVQAHDIPGGMPMLWARGIEEGDPHGVIHDRTRLVRSWIEAGRVGEQ